MVCQGSTGYTLIGVSYCDRWVMRPASRSPLDTQCDKPLAAVFPQVSLLSTERFAASFARARWVVVVVVALARALIDFMFARRTPRT